MEFERGPTWDLAAYDPCPDCGVRDIDMRDPVTRMPHSPPPIEWIGWQCLSCQQKGYKEKELSDGYNGEPPLGMRVRGRPYQPPEEESEADS